MNISAIIITFNEERNIARCLKSLQGVADEIVVVDSFSTDKTKEISISLGANFIEHAFEGYIQQKNWAMSQSKYPYVLSLDADEELSDELKKSVLNIKSNWDADGYTFNRLTYYCGSWIKHGSWYPDVKLRLWDRRKGKWGGTNPHDKFEMQTNARIKHLKGDLLHYSYYTIQDHITQIQKFTDISSKELFEKEKKSTLVKILFSSRVKFIRNYIFKLGFLDGYAGYRIAKISAFTTFLKYAKLKELNDFKKNESNKKLF